MSNSKYDEIERAFCQAWENTVRHEHMTITVNNAQAIDVHESNFAKFVQICMGMNPIAWADEKSFNIIEREIVSDTTVNLVMQTLTMRFWSLCPLTALDCITWANTACTGTLGVLHMSEAFRDSVGGIIDVKQVLGDPNTSKFGGAVVDHLRPHSTLRGVFFISFLIWMFSRNVLEMTQSAAAGLDG
jgi:hypothetical protein